MHSVTEFFSFNQTVTNINSLLAQLALSTSDLFNPLLCYVFCYRIIQSVTLGFMHSVTGLFSIWSNRNENEPVQRV